jgi:hypothetical protein
MANRRMFSKAIVQSSKFLRMPVSARELYFQLGMYADDDGYCEWYPVVQLCSARESDLQTLHSNELVIIFDKDVLLVKDWKVNNLIKSDRYTPSIYVGKYALLEDGTQAEPTVFQSGTQVVPQDRIGKDSKVKVRKVEESASLWSIKKEDFFQELAEANQVPVEFVQSKYQDLVDYCESTGKTYKDYAAALRSWVKKDALKVRMEAYKPNYSRGGVVDARGL